ncbi:PspC domain-containing protein [Acinetobacter gerneri]|uniref:PspC domain-containing protein n=1 Tax=Acinetobacter gerneri TaxID=202952 RepID=A0AAW8JGS1_9GAMM|nr:PspC domain-containing protein [Acinetobacter gerneri]MDQ9010721.1 PspC domain-containing protein [Acinetobacter gerneri]MDQ9014453.1 PspC domain-containing protein [Acinetobacter gerneri]MDQ9025624.1 PspC domain-containing protein [Acinetobacter gerneri]MDQ9052905.1 PspC domain-containing protein [Acinetobacter gerneri]MDQ9060492.1 PspC domain-containing protein [Acinetobacter gerneri]
MTKSGLYRSNRQHMIAGVMGGIAEHFGWNANLLRLIFVIISCMSAAFPGILVYLILWFVMPKRENSPLDAPYNDQRPMRTVNQDQYHH